MGQAIGADAEPRVAHATLVQFEILARMGALVVIGQLALRGGSSVAGAAMQRLAFPSPPGGRRRKRRRRRI